MLIPSSRTAVPAKRVAYADGALSMTVMTSTLNWLELIKPGGKRHLTLWQSNSEAPPQTTYHEITRRARGIDVYSLTDHAAPPLLAFVHTILRQNIRTENQLKSGAARRDAWPHSENARSIAVAAGDGKNPPA